MSRDSSVLIALVSASSGAPDWLCFRICARDAALGRGYANEGGVQDVSGSLLITITTDTFVLHPPSLPRRGAADGRWTDTKSCGTPTQPRVSLLSQKMASKCPKCDKTVYFGKFFTGSVEMEQKPNHLFAGWRLYQLLSVFI